MDWNPILEFARGPLFGVALFVFIGGLAFRLARVLGLGWTRDRVPSAGSKTAGVAKSYAKGFLVWPFIPWVRRTFAGNAVTYIAGGIFHLGLFVIIFLGAPHMLGWKSLLGIGWPTLPLPIIDWFAAAAIAALVALGLNRIANPLLRKLSGPAEFINWLFVFLPFVTGFLLTHHLWFRYEAIYAVHVLTVDVMLIWIPFSRISHFAFYFFSKSIHGAQFGKRAVTP